jgi:hypothetical protein
LPCVGIVKPLPIHLRTENYHISRGPVRFFDPGCGSLTGNLKPASYYTAACCIVLSYAYRYLCSRGTCTVYIYIYICVCTHTAILQRCTCSVSVPVCPKLLYNFNYGLYAYLYYGFQVLSAFGTWDLTRP